MHKKQNNFLQMLAATKVTCNAHASVWASSASFTASYNAGVVDTLSQSTLLLAQQGSSPKGITAGKKGVRTELEEQVWFIISRIALYAAISADADLQEAARLPRSAISRALEDALVGMAERIATLADAHATPLAPYGVTGAIITALRDTASAFSAMIGTPARLRKTAAEATAALKALLAAARKELGVMDAHLVLWAESAPEFVSEYRTARRIGAPGFRTRALTVRVLDAQGKLVAGAALTVPAAKLKRKTSAKGACWINHLPPGEYKARLTADGHPQKDVSFAISKGQTTKLDIVL